jgi:hypothetical protein
MGIAPAVDDPLRGQDEAVDGVCGDIGCPLLDSLIEMCRGALSKR